MAYEKDESVAKEIAEKVGKEFADIGKGVLKEGVEIGKGVVEGLFGLLNPFS